MPSVVSGVWLVTGGIIFTAEGTQAVNNNAAQANGSTKNTLQNCEYLDIKTPVISMTARVIKFPRPNPISCWAQHNSQLGLAKQS